MASNASNHRDTQASAIVDLIACAVRAEGRGQLNIGKLLRASATALARRGAAARGFPDDVPSLAADLRKLAGTVGRLGIEPEVCERIWEASQLMRSGEQSYLGRFPDPWVCRRCGFMSLAPAAEFCGTCGAHRLTFERFEPVYWLSAYGNREVVDRLESSLDLFREAIGRIPPGRCDWKSTPTSWSATDVLRHVRDANDVLAQRVELILDQDNPSLAFQPVFEWTGARNEPASASEVLEAFAASRTAIVARLRRIRCEDWSRPGAHEELGPQTLLEQASYFAAHELTHLRQLEMLRRILRTSANEGPMEEAE